VDAVALELEEELVELDVEPAHDPTTPTDPSGE
jgi:hypothetical protein